MPRAGGFYGPPFKTGRGVVQGDPWSPDDFNVVVDAVVRAWLHQSIGTDAARFGLRMEVRDTNVEFYADDGLVAARDPAWLQQSFDALVSLFRKVGLETNATKTKVMVCLPGAIAQSFSEEAYQSQQTGLGVFDDRKRQLVECHVCGKSLRAGSLRSHLENIHNILQSTLPRREIQGDTE